MTETRKRTATEVIDQAILENRFGEILLYVFSVVSFLVGVGVLVVGVIRNQQVIAALGTISAAFFYPAMRLARGIREQNMAIRLLEIPLSNSRTAQEAANVLRDFFLATIPPRTKARTEVRQP